MKLIHAHEFKDLIHEVPFWLLSGGIWHPVQWELSVGPLASATALFQVPFLDSLASVTVNVSSFFLHHFPNSVFEFFDTGESGAAVRARAGRGVDVVAGLAGEFESRVLRCDDPVGDGRIGVEFAQGCFADDFD